MCAKAAKCRTLDDVVVVVKWMKEVPSFLEFAPYMDEHQLIVYCLCLKLRIIRQYEALCKIGEMPYEVFYVLEGQIGVTNLNVETYNASNLEDRVFHQESKGATIGEASILYNSMR